MFAKNFFGALSLIVAIVGYAPYVVTILNGKTKPHVFSWVIWTLAVTLAFVAQLSRDAGPGAWVTGCTMLACMAITGLALRYGEKDITHSDELIFGVTLAAIPIWAVTRDPLWSVLLLCVIGNMGFVPTFRKTYEEPFSENAPFYISVVLKFLLGIVALDHYSFVTVLYPLNSVLINGLFLGMMLWRRRAVGAQGFLVARPSVAALWTHKPMPFLR